MTNSAIEVRELGDADAARWDAFVAQCPEATFFHRAGWRRVIEDSFGKTCRLGFHDDERERAYAYNNLSQCSQAQASPFSIAHSFVFVVTTFDHRLFLTARF